MKVRCQVCRLYASKDELRPSGLGWIHNDCFKNRTRPPLRSQPRRRSSARSTDPSPETRQRVLNRDAHRCRLCSMAASHLHHINYRSEGVDNQPHNLITLCPACHGIVHSDKRRWKPICLAYIWLREVNGQCLTLPEIERRVRPR